MIGKLMFIGLLFIFLVLWLVPSEEIGGQVKSMRMMGSPEYAEAVERGLPNEQYLEEDIDCENKCDIMNGTHSLVVEKFVLFNKISCYCVSAEGSDKIW